MTNKEEFIELLRSTDRTGIEECIANLLDLGFFEAPASTKFHLNEERGLLQHSLNLCHIAFKVRESMLELDDSLRESLPKDSVIISTLLHDVCKADIYKKTIKRQKNAFGNWTVVPGYDVDYSNFPIGHGEKSVIILLRYGLDLTDDEIIAIRWHMQAWDLAFQSADAKANLNTAKQICPLLTLVQVADALASNLIERKMC